MPAAAPCLSHWNAARVSRAVLQRHVRCDPLAHILWTAQVLIKNFEIPKNVLSRFCRMIIYNEVFTDDDMREWILKKLPKTFVFFHAIKLPVSTYILIPQYYYRNIRVQIMKNVSFNKQKLKSKKNIYTTFNIVFRFFFFVLFQCSYFLYQPIDIRMLYVIKIIEITFWNVSVHLVKKYREIGRIHFKTEIINLSKPKRCLIPRYYYC